MNIVASGLWAAGSRHAVRVLRCGPAVHDLNTRTWAVPVHHTLRTTGTFAPLSPAGWLAYHQLPIAFPQWLGKV
jgi:hypothetical protein